MATNRKGMPSAASGERTGAGSHSPRSPAALALALGALALLALGAPSRQESTAPQDPEAEPCSTPEHRRFDFWVGTWEVYSGDSLAGRNVIAEALGGCAIHESWESAGGAPGHSYSFYDASREQWHQTWIDARGGALYLDGGWNGNAMVMGDDTNRITWTPLDGGRVRQHWETTSDGGETWTTVFDGEYRPVE